MGTNKACLFLLPNVELIMILLWCKQQTRGVNWQASISKGPPAIGFLFTDFAISIDFQFSNCFFDIFLLWTYIYLGVDQLFFISLFTFRTITYTKGKNINNKLTKFYSVRKLLAGFLGINHELRENVSNLSKLHSFSVKAHLFPVICALKVTVHSRIVTLCKTWIRSWTK